MRVIGRFLRLFYFFSSYFMVSDHEGKAHDSLEVKKKSRSWFLASLFLIARKVQADSHQLFGSRGRSIQ